MAATSVRSYQHSSWRPVLLLLLLVLYPSTVCSSTHTVTQLPGFDGPLPFSLETGYVEVDEDNGVHLFYYFMKSEREPARDPLLLWLQGGPGCSGLSGLIYETGPFLFEVQFMANNGYEGGLPHLIYRNETWTKVSNIIFVDSPVGTGFSYATTKAGFKSSDIIATKQLFIFLEKWMDEHPQFISNLLYIAGTSYGGIMVPSLTLEIDRLNRKGPSETPPFNLKGYIIGNPRTDNQTDTDGKYKFFHGMGLIPDELYELAKESCGGRYYQPSNHQCAALIESIDHCTKDINVLHILEPSCESLWRPRTHYDEMSRVMLESSSYDLPSPPFKCREDSYVLSFIWANDEAVRKALGVRQDTVAEWIRHNRSIPYNMDIPSTIEHHLRLFKKGYRSLIYSGDHDSGFSSVGTQAWIRSLNLSVTDEWRPWFADGQIAGYTRSYSSNLTFATVKGAGHTAPEYKPKECLEMFARWISSTPL